MATPLISLTGDGTAPVVSLTFSFIDRAYVKATVNGVNAPFTWTGDSQITFTNAAPIGSDVRVYRETPIGAPLVDFEDTSLLSAADLDLADEQLRHHQEEVDTRVATSADVAAAAVAADASADAAANSATAAANSASSAGNSETAAAASETASAASQAAAAASASAASDSEASAAASAAAAQAVEAGIAAIPNATAHAASRAGLAALSITGGPAFLRETGREGMFVWDGSDLSAAVASDPSQALYVAPGSDATGASGAWVRKFKGPLDVRWFGATGDGTTDDRTAIQAALTYANAIGGAEILFPIVPPQATTSYLVSGYLSVYPKTRLKGMGRSVTTIKTNAVGGGGANASQNLRNGSIFYSEQPINGSTRVDIYLEDLGLKATNGANVGAGYYDRGGTYWSLRRVRVDGFAYGVVMEQSELADIYEGDFENQTAAGVWLVDGADLTVGASGDWTNRIGIYNSQFNQPAGAYGIRDGGGANHAFVDNNYNGGLNSILIEGVTPVAVRGGQFESAAGSNIKLTGANYLTVEGGTYTQTAGNAAIDFTAGGGTLSVGGVASFSGGSGTNPIIGASNLFRLWLGAIANNTAVALYSGTPTHLNDTTDPIGAGDKGDVVIDGSGNMVVEAATPADGTFNVTGSVVATAGASFNLTGGFTYEIQIGTAGYIRTTIGGDGVTPDINIRPVASQKGVISFTHDATADRWSLGIKSGDGTFYWSQGDRVLGNVKMSLSSAGDLTATSFKVGANKVVGARVTGWGADTGTAKRTANATYSGTAEGAYTQATIQTLMNAVRDLSQAQKALKDDLISHGLIGA